MAETTTTELAIELIARFGYLVFAYEDEVPVGGTINSSDVEGAQTLGQPFVVIGETTQDEYEEQQEVLEELAGAGDTDHLKWPHYYRVTTD